ncbi:MAG: DNA-3-methyladenine glycosylase I [Bacteroidales bacterium]
MYENYHDEEWETPLYDATTLFVFLILETFQAGSLPGFYSNSIKQSC